MSIKLLEALKKGKFTKKSQEEQRVEIPFNMLKFTCKNHFGPNKKKMPYAVVFSNSNDLEFKCECGTTYVRTRDLEEQEEF
jgi:hypothetical protein